MADELTITIRVHDPLEKKDAKLSAYWVVEKIDRSVIGTSAEALAKQLVPLLQKLENLKLT